MKNLLIRLFALSILFSGTAMYGQKIAHVNVDSLLTMMPEFKLAKEKSEAKLKELEGFLQSMKMKYEEQLQAYQTNYDKMSDFEKKSAEEDLTTLQQKIQAKQVEAQQDYQTFTGAIQKPIFDKVNKAIEMVAKEGGFKYVLSKAEGLVLYADPAEDILPLVKKKLDSMPPAKLPDGAGGGTTTPNKNTNPGGGKTTPKGTGK